MKNKTQSKRLSYRYVAITEPTANVNMQTCHGAGYPCHRHFLLEKGIKLLTSLYILTQLIAHLWQVMRSGSDGDRRYGSETENETWPWMTMPRTVLLAASLSAF